MSVIRFIGDIHGIDQMYRGLAESSPHPTVQIGDFGYGFRDERDMRMNEWFAQNPGHRFIRGNHDNPAKCKASSGFIPDGHVEDNMMFVGGAWSIDWEHRRPGVSWWPDEEVSEEQFDEIIDLYAIIKPDVMVTHDAPSMVAEWHLGPYDRVFGSRTARAFDKMFSIHRPKLWVYGHWHDSSVHGVDGTTFVCVDELDWVDIDTKDAKIVASNRLLIKS